MKVGLLFFVLLCYLIKVLAQNEIDYKLLQYCYKGNFDSVLHYLNKGADPNAISSDGTPAIFYALQSGKIMIIKSLVLNGANVNVYAHGYTPLLLAILYNNYEACKFLIEKGANVNFILKDRISLLHYAVKNSDYNIVNLLLLHKSDVNYQDKEGNSPLFWAIKYLRNDLLDLLYKAGANFNLQNKKGQTPILFALETGNKNMVFDILKYPLNLNVCDYEKRCICYYALQTNDKSIYRIIDSLTKCQKSADELYYFYYSEQYKNAKYYSKTFKVKYRKPIIKYFSIGSVNKFLNRDYFTGINFAVWEVRYRIGCSLSYWGRFWYRRILVKDTDLQYFQLWEKRDFFEVSFTKYFILKSTKCRLYIFKPSLGILYTKGKYRGVENKVSKKNLLISSFVLYVRNLNYGVNYYAGINFFDTYYDIKCLPLFLVIGITFNVIIKK
ncbi:MAG: ankyrin repeat domain-containing protein [Bacteroidales bacterium]|nr:ankyrin repeat domain-containing protein [Bacteroidales bacterium]